MEGIANELTPTPIEASPNARPRLRSNQWEMTFE